MAAFLKTSQLAAMMISVLAITIIAGAVSIARALDGSATLTSVNPAFGQKICAASATDIKFTITNDGGTTIDAIQFRMDSNWQLISTSAVVVAGLGGSPSVGISGTGPFVATVSGIGLDPTAPGEVTLQGMVANVNTGAAYTAVIEVYASDTGSGNPPNWGLITNGHVEWTIVITYCKITRVIVTQTATETTTATETQTVTTITTTTSTATATKSDTVTTTSSVTIPSTVTTPAHTVTKTTTSSVTIPSTVTTTSSVTIPVTVTETKTAPPVTVTDISTTTAEHLTTVRVTDQASLGSPFFIGGIVVATVVVGIVAFLAGRKK